MQEIAPGLYRWTAEHPGWSGDHEPGSPADWPPEVGCVAHEAPDTLVLVDPLIVEDRWEDLDALVERTGKPVAVLTTMRFHTRSRDAVAERYGGSLVSQRETPPAGVERIPIEHADESMVWLEGPRALVPGDRLLGDDAGGLRMCPEAWLRYLQHPPTHEELRAALMPLLDLPVEIVLTTHWDPVLSDGREAIRRALHASII